MHLLKTDRQSNITLLFFTLPILTFKKQRTLMPLQHGFRWGEFLFVDNQERPSGKKWTLNFRSFFMVNFIKRVGSIFFISIINIHGYSWWTYALCSFFLFFVILGVFNIKLFYRVFREQFIILSSQSPPQDIRIQPRRTN